MHISGVFRRLRVLLPFLVLLVAVSGPAGCNDCNLRITTEDLPDGIVGENYSFGLSSQCGGDFWFLDHGNLPPGIGLLTEGQLRGTPTLAGSFSFTLGVVNGDTFETALKGFVLTVQEIQ
jgi:hypothetical protein